MTATSIGRIILCSYYLITTKADKWFMIKECVIIQREYATSSAARIFIHGYPMKRKHEYFKQPSNLNITMSDGEVGTLKSFEISEISAVVIFAVKKYEIGVQNCKIDVFF